MLKVASPQCLSKLHRILTHDLGLSLKFAHIHIHELSDMLRAVLARAVLARAACC